jgi:hypothetical protein
MVVKQKHDYDDNRPAPKWLVDASLEYLNSQLNNSPSTANPKDIEIASKLALSADAAGAFLSDLEAVTADFIGVGIIASGCGTQAGCIPAVGLAWGIDYGITSSSPLGIAENVAGGIGLMATAYADIRLGNTQPTTNGFAIGKDTLVSARNTAFGIIPEANIDAIVSNSQLKYDLDRYLQNKPGGSIVITGDDLFSGTKNIFNQFFFKDWW